MPTDALFPPTPRERLAVVAKFVTEERSFRWHMLDKYGDDAGQHIYWQKRVTQCDEALAHLAALTEAMVP
jgi:hypothetical protein